MAPSLLTTAAAHRAARLRAALWATAVPRAPRHAVVHVISDAH